MASRGQFPVYLSLICPVSTVLEYLHIDLDFIAQIFKKQTHIYT